LPCVPLDLRRPFYYTKVRNILLGKEFNMTVATITTKGQTTIPKKIREHLKLHAGDRVDFLIDDSGKVLLRPTTSDVKELEGILHRPGMKTVTVEEMSRAIKARHKRA